ncbi:hypothetical protein M427DRAFT_56627 [Gonapodya prolifera JEL478]|uniref:Band 7 domain-containing protein n=1 Tax=Gonapodya prolifera (strain JEL478) TaxID=1344416 RepID=A0A139AG33_GONPJ|nr:hypothetical protein M427DRAFT_56627 [Gonapodya prolifera JEL478]|eukprot:KXS15524.1 hypothetical protein M427DRAFT_56627 [Gonapodya prolifera JEL478]
MPVIPLYIVASPTQFVVKTGFGIDDMVIQKKCWVFPGQKFSILEVTPTNFPLNLHVMSAEKLEFQLPAVFTIGPRAVLGMGPGGVAPPGSGAGIPESAHDEFIDIASLKKYARLLATKNEEHINEIVKGIIEGETRVIAASMTLEEIFKENRIFKENVIKHVQAELDHFGLIIYNANVKQLQDTPGSEYFSYLRLKTHEGAVNQAKVDVAEAKYRGDVGEKERQGLTRQNVARVEAETVVYENDRKEKVAFAAAQLATKQAEFDRQVRIAQIEADQAAAARRVELQRTVEQRRGETETERLRAEVLAKATVEFESNVKTADARLYAKSKEAEAVTALFRAQADGIAMLTKAFNGDTHAVLQYLMLERGLFTELAKANAEAIRGLQPKITVWNTGEDGGKGDAGPAGAIRDVFKMLPPLLTTVQEQTGVTPPAWLAGMGGAPGVNGLAEVEGGSPKSVAGAKAGRA